MISKSQIEPIRSGAIASFPNKDALIKGFNNVPKLLSWFNGKEFKDRHGTEGQPPNILYVALRIFDDQDDQDSAKWHGTFIQLVNERKPIVAVARENQFDNQCFRTTTTSPRRRSQERQDVDRPLARDQELRRLQRLHHCPSSKSQFSFSHKVTFTSRLIVS